MKLLSLAFLALSSVAAAATSTPSRRAGAATAGSWSPVLNLPLSPLSGALLPNGEILLWSGVSPGGWTSVVGGTQTNFVIVTADQLLKQSPAIELKVTQNPEMFCPGTAVLLDGSILVNGGSGPEATIIFNMNTKTFSQGGLMNIPRGYNANTLTTSDKVFTIGGSFARSYTDTRTGRKFGVGNKDGELWTQGANGGTWAISNPGSGNLIGGIEAGSTSPDPEGIYRSDNHAWLFPFRSSTGDDMIFHAGPSARMHTINLSKGTVAGAGFRSTDPYSMNGNAVQYSPGRVFKVGGAPYYGNSNSSVGMPTSAAAFTINYTGLVTGGGVQVRAAGNMNFKRSFGHALALPGGKILIVGGQSAIHLFSDTAGILTPELYSPDTGVFTQLAPMATARNYHSLALLLKDGRVLLAGGGAAQNACKTPGVKPCAPSTHFNAEIYTPPYLSAGQARPVITSASTGLTATYGPRLKIGGTLTVKATGCGTGGCSYELLRLHAATHSVDNDAARVPLQVAKRDATNGDQVHIFATDTPFVLSGYYYLFAIAANGTPSVATMVQVTRT
ncbi:hypothetical protein HDU88_008198 [Geranomyces variabilis]|nr:hypothetical protein HDU88_008198 [Geranomyces variabilis]